MLSNSTDASSALKTQKGWVTINSEDSVRFLELQA